MFPESFAETWIERLTRRGDWVLDPFSGRGTTPLSALLLERRAVASDINDVAFCLTKAKAKAPTLRTLLTRVDELENAFDARQWLSSARAMPAFFHVAFARPTLHQLIYMRHALQWRTNKTDGMIAALILGCLHGDIISGSYLSNQMPRTISTKPEYSLRYWARHRQSAPSRDVFGIVRQWAQFRYRSDTPKGESRVLQLDVRDLPKTRVSLPRTIRCVVTSPPYFDTTDFAEDQWLRLWFLGAASRQKGRGGTNDDRHRGQERYWQFIADMWRSLGHLLATRANVVIRIGGRRLKPELIRTALAGSSRFSGRMVELVSFEVTHLKNRQTPSFRPDTKGIGVEVDCHFYVR